MDASDLYNTGAATYVTDESPDTTCTARGAGVYMGHKRPCAVRDVSSMPLSQYFNVREPQPIRSEAAGE